MNYEKIGRFLKELREEKKLSQYQLADEIKMDRTLITKIENGKASVTLTNLVIFCEFFDISINELLAGERKTENNDDVFDEVAYNMLSENNKLRVRIKIVLSIILFLLLSFFVYFFITTYNSTFIYTVNTSNESIHIKNGLFVKTRDKIYLRLEPELKIDEDSVSSISLYYLSGDERKNIYKSSKLSLIAINDFFDTQEYFDLNDFDKIKNNLYISIITKDNKETSTKLDFEKDYVNSQLFVFKGKNKKVDSPSEKHNETISKILETYNEQWLKVTYEKKDYDVIVNDSSISVKYKEKDDEIQYKYDILDYVYFSKSVNSDEVYTYMVEQNKCISGKCENILDEYDLFMMILSKLSDE